MWGWRERRGPYTPSVPGTRVNFNSFYWSKVNLQRCISFRCTTDDSVNACVCVCVCVCVLITQSCQTLWPHGPIRLLYPENSPGKNTGVGWRSPGDLPEPGIKPWSPVLQADSLPSEPQGSPLSYAYIPIYLSFLRFFSIINYKTMNTVPCTMQ